MAKHFEYIGIQTGERRQYLATVLANSVRSRIRAGLDVFDGPAKPLTIPYSKYKIRAGRKPIRDWTLTGRTLRALGPVTTADNQLAVGFSDPTSAKIAAINNTRDLQFGASQGDLKTLMGAVAQLPLLQLVD